MTKENYTEIVIVLDRSGSMQNIKSDMVGAFEKLIKEQQEIPGECSVSLIQFDNVIEEVYSLKKIASVPSLVLEPRNSTALLDAIGKAIDDTGKRLAAMVEEERPSKVAVVIITDGMENSSTKYNRKQIFEMVEHQRTKYSWEFIFIGANQDAIAEAAKFGISAQNAMSYTADSKGVIGSTNFVSNRLRTYRTTN